MGKSGNPAKRAEDETTPAGDYAMGPVTDTGTEDFDQFWQQRDRKRPATTIMGRRVELPPALPLRFEMEARLASRSKSEADVQRLVGILFGEDALEHWRDNGMDLEQFMVLLAWAPRVIAGQQVTLAEVADAVRAHLHGDDEGDESGEA